jgi:hypothetical protein
MYVRTDPVQRARRVVSEIEAKRIDLEWSVRSISRGLISVDEMTVDKVALELAREEERGIDRVDAVREALNRLSESLAIRRQWGLFRNVQFDFAEVDLWVGDYKSALSHLLDVRYLDCNGPRNVAEWNRPESDEDSQQVISVTVDWPDNALRSVEAVPAEDEQDWDPLFDSDLPSLTRSDIPFIVDSGLPFSIGLDLPYIDQIMEQVIELLGTSVGDILLEYTPHAVHLQQSLDLPVAWTDASLMLASRLIVRS